MTKTVFTKLMSAILAGALLTLALLSCGITANAADLMKKIEAPEVSGKPADEKFLSAMADFSLNLYRQSSISCSDGNNFLISPVSAAAALGMTANGADGNTKAQFETLFGLSADDMNRYMLSYLDSLATNDKGVKLSIADSIWFDNGLTVDSEFLAVNKAYYRAQMYQASFSDSKTVDELNRWVKTNTDGMIDKLLEAFPTNAVMCLVNAVCFDAEWKKKYEKSDVHDGNFYNLSGTTSFVPFLHSTEHRYIETSDGTTGMMKYYKGGRYAFAAFLPAEGINIHDFIAELDGETFLSLCKNAEYSSVNVKLPKFQYDCDMSLAEPLVALGLTDAFGPEADFSGISQFTGLAIDDVIHKTHIELDENGTKAAAVTGVIMTETAAEMPEHSVVFDRPFVYAIIDTETNLPLFLGTVTELG